MTDHSFSRRSVLKKGAIATSALVLGGTAASGTAAAGIGDGRVGHYNLNNLHLNKDTDKKIKNFVHDASPEKNHGTNKGAEVVKDGAVGKAFAFDGGDDSIIVDHDESLSSTTITVSTWLKFTESAAYHFFLSKRGDDNEYQMYYRGADSGPGKTLAYYDGDNIYEDNLSLDKGVWHHLAWVVDKEDGFRGYHDGNKIVTKDAGTPNEGTSSLYIGTDNVGQFAKGMVDEVRVYNRALSDAEITELYEMKD